MTYHQKIEKVEIKIDSEDAIDNFGNEIFEQSIIFFVDEGYNNYKEGITLAQETKDHSKIKILTHTLKTSARYMSSENFAQICQSIETETKGPNWDKINELLPTFFHCLDLLYNECIKHYNEFKPENEHKTTLPIKLENETNDKNDLCCESNKSIIVSAKTSTNDLITEKNKVLLKTNKPIIDMDDDTFEENSNNKKYIDILNTSHSHRSNHKMNLKSITTNKENLEVEEVENNRKMIENRMNNSNNNFANSFIVRRKSFLPIQDNLINKEQVFNSESCDNDNNKVNNLEKKENENIELYIPSQLSPIQMHENITDKISKKLNDVSIGEINFNNNLNNIDQKGAYNVSISTPIFKSSNYEIAKSKTDITDDKKDSPSKKGEEGSIFKKRTELSHSNSSSNLNANLKDPKNCIKSLRDIDKPTSNGSYFKPKLDEKPKGAPTNQDFKSIFI